MGAWFSEGSVTILLEYANRHSLRGLEILHKARCIHRDIKPGNILVNSDAECKLTDFGVVTALEGTMDLATTFVGTTIYMAPERITQDQAYSYPSDVWSLGISLWHLAVGSLPYQTDGGYFGIIKSIAQDPVPALPALHPVSKQPYSAAFRDFLARCLAKDPSARATASQLLSHPFLREAGSAWEAAVAAAGPSGEVHPLMKLSAADSADLDALVLALYNSVYSLRLKTAGPTPPADYRKSLMDQARLQRLAQGVNNARLPLQVVQQRFEKVYQEKRAAGL